jgi:hypothetical protein
LSDDASTSIPPAERGGIAPIAIETELKRSYLDYAMSVIVSRALPDARDGLSKAPYMEVFGGFSNSKAMRQSGPGRDHAGRRLGRGEHDPGRRRRRHPGGCSHA